ncbi:PFL_4669 family integrating conjugative element protein [Pseudomonas putida]|uniref:Conjugal transfer protein n=1 Tax=Pseudomonas putida TaxID=303 RepID=A0A177SV77_PSEPU|nr:TIGR03761 family integrating conjugative element protein [Pseudomonas putida]OAI94855.1 conjugal transfer protein [Pseudomonas putida]
MSNDLQLNLGALRSSMQLTLHTHHASRIWHGRAAAEDRAGIIGLNGFIAIMNKMKRGAEQDDPYSDYWMLRIETKLDETKIQLQLLGEQIDQVISAIPKALSLGENLNVQPISMPLFINAQLGFAAVYLLADFDDLARRVILAHHTALIDRQTLERWLNEGSHALRSLFSLAQQYKFSGAQRDDFAANNAVARNARERYGELPQDILEGTRRSRFAPQVTRRGGSGPSAPVLPGSTESAEDGPSTHTGSDDPTLDEDVPQ